MWVWVYVCSGGQVFGVGCVVWTQRVAYHSSGSSSHHNSLLRGRER